MSTKPRTRLSPSARIGHLLDVAKQVIMSDGLQSFTMESLARTAAVSSALVYIYFSNRQALLEALLEREYRLTGTALFSEVVNASSFEEVISIFVTNNFNSHTPGNIVPVLLSQPRIADSIRELRKQRSEQTARFLIENTAKTYKLNVQTGAICRRHVLWCINGCLRVGGNEYSRSEASDRYGTNVYQGGNERSGGRLARSPQCWC